MEMEDRGMVVSVEVVGFNDLIAIIYLTEDGVHRYVNFKPKTEQGAKIMESILALPGVDSPETLDEQLLLFIYDSNMQFVRVEPWIPDAMKLLKKGVN